jgi:hypothetical protein
MVRGLLLKDNKGVSLMIGYVLLIVIAISISIGVFAFLKLYVPLDKPECSDDISVRIDEANCENGEFNITMTNNGLFTADGVQIRIGESGRIVKTLLNNGTSGFRFIDLPGSELKPGQTWESPNFEYTSYTAGDQKEIETEALIFIDNRPILCENSVEVRNIICDP